MCSCILRFWLISCCVKQGGKDTGEDGEMPQVDFQREGETTTPETDSKPGVDNANISGTMCVEY